MSLQGRGLGGGQLAQDVGAQTHPQVVVLVLVHSDTSISSITMRKALSP